MQYITVRITGPTHPYLDTQVAAAAMLLGNARWTPLDPYRVAENVGRLGLDWFGPGESGWTSSTRFVILVA